MAHLHPLEIEALSLAKARHSEVLTRLITSRTDGLTLSLARDFQTLKTHLKAYISIKISYKRQSSDWYHSRFHPLSPYDVDKVRAGYQLAKAQFERHLQELWPELGPWRFHHFQLYNNQGPCLDFNQLARPKGVQFHYERTN